MTKAQAEERIITRKDVLGYLDYVRDMLCDPESIPLGDDAGLATFAREEMIKSVAEARFVVAINGPDEWESVT